MKPLFFLAGALVSAAAVGGIVWAVGTEEPTAETHLTESGGYRFATAVPSEHDALSACVACHRVEVRGPERSAPSLVGLVGAPVARSDWFGYSPALRRVGGTWTVEALDRYLADPVGAVPGTFKTLSPIRDEAARSEVIEALSRL